MKMLRITTTYSLALVAALAATSLGLVQGRLYHVPLARPPSMQRRALTDNNDIDLDALYQARGVQYADLKVGCPAQSQSAIISTASSAIGFPCSGCTNDCGEGSHLNGLYQQELSSCFEEIACGDCLLSSYNCNEYRCPVGLSYTEGSSWHGIEVQDMVSIGGEDADEEAFPLRFGCQNDITGLFEDQIPDGIFGMNKQKGSAIKQWSSLGYLEASAFSLCYNVREDVTEKSGVMMLGGSDERLHDKPMVFAKDVGAVDGNYEVRIKGVHLKLGPALSEGPPTNGAAPNSVAFTSLGGLDGTDKAVLDSGTTCSYLKREWHSSLLEAWNQMTDGKYPMFSHLDITDAQLDELPTIVFELKGTEHDTIMVDYPPIRYMEKSEMGGWDFCLYDSDQTVTLGNTFMAGHDVLHDLANGRIGFAESSCQPATIGISVSSDADQAQLHVQSHNPLHGRETAPPRKDPPPTELPPNFSPGGGLKPIVMQPQPIQKRTHTNHATKPGMIVLYVVLGLSVVGLAFFSWQRYQSGSMTSNLWWSEPTTKNAYQLSCISLVMTILAIIAGIALFSSTGSSLFLVLALENCVDFLSSAVVLWRFFAPSDVTDKLEAKLKRREERASIAVSMVLVVLGVGVWITAIQDLSRGQEEPGTQNLALVISFVSFVCFGILTWFKFHYSKLLESPSLYKDGICSLIGTTLSVSLFVDTLIIKSVPSVWWIDPIVAIGCGFASLVYGVAALFLARYQDKLPIFSLAWWFQQDQEEVDTKEDNTVTESENGQSQQDYFT